MCVTVCAYGVCVCGFFFVCVCPSSKFSSHLLNNHYVFVCNRMQQTAGLGFLVVAWLAKAALNSEEIARVIYIYIYIPVFIYNVYI